MNERETQQNKLAGDDKLRRKFGTPDIPVSTSVSDSMPHYIESADFFFIATSNRAGECDSSNRGKRKGVPPVKILDGKTIIFPDYPGNGSFRSLGNILENPHIGMLFMDFRTGMGIRVNDDAEISEDPGWVQLFLGNLQTVRVTVREAYKQTRPV